MHQQITTYERNPLVSDYTRRRNRHVELAQRGIARAGSVRLDNGNVIVWRVDEVGCYHECGIV